MLLPFSSAPTPQATSSILGKILLTNDLGGTASSPTTPTAVHLAGTETITGAKTFSNTLTMADGQNIATGTTTGSMIGASTSQKLGFFGATPVVQQSASGDIGAILNLLGFRAAGSTYTIGTSGKGKFDGPFQQTPTLKSATSSITTGSSMYNLCNATSGAQTQTLPTAVANGGFLFHFKKTDSSVNSVTIATTSSQTIDGATTYLLATQYKYVTLISDGANWFVVSNN